MSRVFYVILIISVIFTFFGCDADQFNTSHPNEGGIILTVDWSNVATNAPTTYQVRLVFPSGSTKVIDNLAGVTNNLVAEPGETMMYVYNEAEYINVSGNKAYVNPVDGGIAHYPGLFFSYYDRIFTERDKDITHKAAMMRQTGELKFTFAIKPANMIGKIKTIHATLDGVASTFDMQTGELSASSVIRTALSKNSYYATAIIRLLGFDSSSKQNLRLDIELENGSKTSVTTDLTSLVSEFNHSKNALFSLNADLYISDGYTPIITTDRWERNSENRYLSISPTDITLNHSASDESVIITTDQQSWVYSVIKTGDWLTVTKSDNRLHLATTANTSGIQREATITVSAGGLNESVNITQQSYMSPPSTSFIDKEVVKLQSATAGKGVNLVLMGDGYTVNDMDKGTGKYERDMRTAVDHFFSVYPYSRYRDHFNIFMIAAISNQQGISDKSTHTQVDNKFETIWEGGNSSAIDCNAEIVLDYLDAIPELESASAHIHDITVILPINASIYAGTCYMYYSNMFTDYGNGFSISLCPVGSHFKSIIMHEAGGHGFAKLSDEYIYYPKDEFLEENKSKINVMKIAGWYENIDFFANITQTSWKGFANLPKYNMVGTFEGANYYGKGIWRPEYNSCMNDNVPYFNAPSRWAQVRRIKQLAGINYSFSQFLLDDIVPDYPATTRSYVEKDFIPLSPPILKDFKEHTKNKRPQQKETVQPFTQNYEKEKSKFYNNLPIRCEEAFLSALH